MNIRTLYFLSALFVGACCMSSCEEGTGEDTDDLSIYWNKSAAFKMQLKGNVKTLVADDSTVFNQSGNILSIHSLGENYVSQHLYTYTNGKLTSEIYSRGEGTNADTTSFTYGTSGKYLPIYPNNINEMKLFKNIASYSGSHNNNLYVASGDSILMISFYAHDYSSYMPMYGADTTSLTFNGGLFPVTIRGYNSVCNITYASDGRFLTAEEEYYGLSSTVTRFKSDSEYLLPIRIEYKQHGVTYSTTTYTYNDNDDIISKDGLNYDEEYSQYVYDSKGNWTSRSFRSKGNDDVWSDAVTQTRQLTYWD